VSPSGAHDDTIICFPQTVQLNGKPSEVLVEVSISRLRVVPPLQRNGSHNPVAEVDVDVIKRATGDSGSWLCSAVFLTGNVFVDLQVQYHPKYSIAELT